jgi:methanethiol S-methyltransferase
MRMKYVLLIALWVLYFTLHSALASAGVKYFFEQFLKSAFRFYRIIYSVIATVGLLALLLFNASITSAVFFKGEGLIRYLSLMLATFGVIVISRSFREYRFSSFVGLKEEVSVFKRSGILKYVRHPIYSGTILIVLGFLLFNPTLATLVSVGCILAYLPVGIFLEEKKLIKQFGDQYRAYKNDVPSVFPRITK